MSIKIGENESAKYWLGVLNSLKNRGLRDILILCADGLTGLKEVVVTAFPQTEFQRCIVHQVRNTLKYVATKDRKNFAADLKKIYTTPNKPTAARIRDEVELKWAKKYPHTMKSWRTNWDAIVPIFKFSPTLRTIVYTTNAIENLNATYRQLNRQRSVFPNDTALLKALFLATEFATKK